MDEKKIRINKYIADAGICSRRDADKLVEQGLVMVNGKIAESGTKVGKQDEVTVRGKRILAGEEKIVLAYYKPVGVTCTERDLHAKKTVIQDLKYPVRVTYAGRLDKESEGLLLMTNDGNLINGLMRAANFHEKEYVVKVDKEITQEFLRDMAAGVYLTELEKTTRPCDVESMGKYTFRIVLTQGLNRQIRRMCKELGYQVKQLRRIRIANIELGKLKPREYRRLTEKELEMLYSKVGSRENE
ncbi:MAG: pseudouridine synthase [Lachnospiraceae bacterium]|nr:pseudouridine synthase [Lachnospiraceae bacterium]